MMEDSILCIDLLNTSQIVLQLTQATSWVDEQNASYIHTYWVGLAALDGRLQQNSNHLFSLSLEAGLNWDGLSLAIYGPNNGTPGVSS